LIFCLKDISAKLQGVSFKGKRLADDQTVSSYGIDRGAVIDILTPLPTVPIIVKNQVGKKIQIDVNGADSVRMLKKKIEEKEGIPLEDQGLCYRGKRLADDQTLVNYNIEKCSVVDLSSPLPNMVIFARTEDGKRVALGVNGADSIRMVKQKVEEKEGLTILFLNFVE
jgi:ubiquitin C